MSLLTACQNVVKETGIGEVPATIIGNTDKTAVQLNALAERAMVKLSKFNWEKMFREQTITTSTGVEGYALPSDWARYVVETAWDATNYWPMRGSIDPTLWQTLKRGLAQPVVGRRRFRLRGGEVLIIPTPTNNTDTLVLEYLRNTPWTDSTGVTYKVVATADTDITVFPQYLMELDLKWRWKHAKGLDYAEDAVEADQELDKALANDVPAPLLDYGYVSSPTPGFWPNIPQIIT